MEAFPDVTGHEGTVRMLLGLLEQADVKIKNLKGVAVANGQSLDDPVSGERATLEDGTVNSYRHQVNAILAQRERLAAVWPEEMEDALGRIRETRETEARSREASRSEPSPPPRAVRRAKAKPKPKARAKAPVRKRAG